MVVHIRENCMACSLCEAECPKQAIYFEAGRYHVDPLRCTACAGVYSQPHCQSVCPIRCIQRIS